MKNEENIECHGDIAVKLKHLQTLKGADYNKTLGEICAMKIFKPMLDIEDVYWTYNDTDLDMNNLKEAAKKAVKFGNKVFIMPNPRITRSPDFIFARNDIYKDYDLKTITGKNSVGNRLLESIGQTRRVLLNMNTDYNPRALAKEIKTYFETNKDALEVLIYKGKRSIVVNRNDIKSESYEKIFISIWHQKK